MPQTSSSGISHRHVATVFQRVILTFMMLVFYAIWILVVAFVLCVCKRLASTLTHKLADVR